MAGGEGFDAALGLACLRGRSRIFHDAAAREDVGPAWPHTRGAGEGPLAETNLDRRVDLLQARPQIAADLPARHDDGQHEGRKLLLA